MAGWRNRRQGFGDRALGDDGHRPGASVSDVSGRISADVIAEFERRIGRGTIGNVVASGTEIIQRLGPSTSAPGKPIVYTSADSVFQIAAHEDVIPIAELYRICETAFDMVGRGMSVGRVIARPFVGVAGTFKRTANRHDYARAIWRDAVDLLDVSGRSSSGGRKDGRPLCRPRHSTRKTTDSDERGIQKIVEAMLEINGEAIFANLVDFDTQYGHRNDVSGYAANLELFDRSS